jgi:hypothetical protein
LALALPVGFDPRRRQRGHKPLQAIKQDDGPRAILHGTELPAAEKLIDARTAEPGENGSLRAGNRNRFDQGGPLAECEPVPECFKDLVNNVGRPWTLKCLASRPLTAKTGVRVP